MEFEAREILRSTLDAPQRADLTWIEMLQQAAVQVGGVDLETAPDTPATAADFRNETDPAQTR
jgi:plasmid stability protein